MVESDERRTRSKSSKRESLLLPSFSFLNQLPETRSYRQCGARFPRTEYVRGCVVVVFPRVCRVRTRVHNARGQAPGRGIYLLHRHTAGPNVFTQLSSHRRAPRSIPFPRVPRAATFSPLTLYLRWAHLHGMHSYEIDHSSADFSSDRLLSQSLPLSLSLPRGHILATIVYGLRGTSLGSLRCAVNPTEDTRDVTRVVENWFVSNDDVLSFSPCDTLATML